MLHTHLYLGLGHRPTLSGKGCGKPGIGIVGTVSHFLCDSKRRRRMEHSDNSYDNDQQHTSKKYPLGKTRVLLVDDHELTQDVVKAMLEHINCDVEVATSGKDAIKIVQQRLFDIVFMDCIMPGMDGFETTRTIRKLEEQPAGLLHRYLATLDEDPRQRPYENSRETTEGINAKKHTTVCPIPQKFYEYARRTMLVAGKNTRSVPAGKKGHHRAPACARLPIIAFTAGILDVEKFLAADMDDILAKPVYLAQLEDKLRQWVI